MWNITIQDIRDFGALNTLLAEGWEPFSAVTLPVEGTVLQADGILARKEAQIPAICFRKLVHVTPAQVNGENGQRLVVKG